MFSESKLTGREPLDAKGEQLLKEEAYDENLAPSKSCIQEAIRSFRSCAERPLISKLLDISETRDSLRIWSNFNENWNQVSQSIFQTVVECVKTVFRNTNKFPHEELANYLKECADTDKAGKAVEGKTRPDTSCYSKLEEAVKAMLNPLSDALHDLNRCVRMTDPGAVFAKETQDEIDDLFTTTFPNRIQAVRDAASEYCDPLMSEMREAMDKITARLPILEESYKAMKTAAGDHWIISREEAEELAWSCVPEPASIRPCIKATEN